MDGPTRLEWLREFGKTRMYEMFTDIAEQLAESVDTPEEAAGIPMAVFELQLKLEYAWNQIIDGLVARDQNVKDDKSPA